MIYLYNIEIKQNYPKIKQKLFWTILNNFNIT